MPLVCVTDPFNRSSSTCFEHLGEPTEGPVDPTSLAGPLTETLIPATKTSTNGDGSEPGSKTAKNTVAQFTFATTPTSISATSVQTDVGNQGDGSTATAAPSAFLNKNDGVSKGAVAGIAIATAIIGAAIAFLVAFLLFKRRRSSSKYNPYDSAPEFVSLAKGGEAPYIQVTNVPTSNGVLAAAAQRNVEPTEPLRNDALAGIIPPPADESTISEKVTTLFNSIHRHVENFYRDVHAGITPTMEGDLGRFGMGAVGMAELLQMSSSPTVAIKHALTGYILGITSPDAEDDQTLFPKAIVGAGDKDQFNESSGLSAAYSLYKRLAVYLHSVRPSPSNTQSRDSDIREAAEHFSMAFFPWANPHFNDQEKEESLVHIMSSALELVIWLYGQPGFYEFVWESTGQRGTIVAPGLAKISEANGTTNGPQMLLQPMVVAT